MKLLHLADLHIGKRVHEYSMLEEQKEVLNQAISMAIEQKVDVVLIAGDVYDKSIPTIEGVKLLDSFLTALSKENIPVLLISGNHDSAERLSFGSELLQTAGIYVAGASKEQIVTIIFSDTYGEVNFYLLPFIKPSQIELKDGEEPRYELVPVRVTPNGVNKVPKDFDRKTSEEIQQMHEEALAEKTNTSNMKNLQPHPRIFTLVNKAKLCRDMSVLGATGKAQTDDEVESVDFGDGPKGKK